MDQYAIDRLRDGAPERANGLVNKRYYPFSYDDGRVQFWDGIPADERVHDADEYSESNIAAWVEHYLFPFDYDEELNKAVWKRLLNPTWVEITMRELKSAKQKLQTEFSSTTSRFPGHREFRAKLNRVDHQVVNRMRQARMKITENNTNKNSELVVSKRVKRMLSEALLDLLDNPCDETRARAEEVLSQPYTNAPSMDAEYNKTIREWIEGIRANNREGWRDDG